MKCSSPVPAALMQPQTMTLPSYIYIYIYIYRYSGGKSKRQTQWAWRQASERFLFNRNNKIKCPKGKNVLNKQGIWYLRRAAGFVKEGQCSGRKGPGKGRSLAAAHAPIWGPGREGRWLLQRLRLPLGPRRSTGLVGPASWPWRPYHGCGLHGNPSMLPSLSHEDTSMHAWERDRFPEERCPRRLTAAVMRLHSRQVCLITRRQTWLFQRLSSLTLPLPSGAWWRAVLKDGVMMMKRGEAAHSSQYIYIYICRVLVY